MVAKPPTLQITVFRARREYLATQQTLGLDMVTEAAGN